MTSQIPKLTQRLKLLDDMDAKEYAIKNAGKRFLVYNPDGHNLIDVLLVGYRGDDLILSTTDSSGLKFEKISDATILLDTPLSVSYHVMEVDVALGIIKEEQP